VKLYLYFCHVSSLKMLNNAVTFGTDGRVGGKLSTQRLLWENLFFFVSVQWYSIFI
jgi:hypothetical protein